MQTHTIKTPGTITFEHAYPGTAVYVGRMRVDLAAAAGGCSLAADFVLLASELAANAVLHSRSGHPGGRFTVRAYLHPGHYAWAEVEDQGGQWTGRPSDDRPHGLEIVSAIARDGNWGIDGGEACRVVWIRLGQAEQP
jgi:anti-sigma regulatory factor (Ser/Thr protein kinase)